MLTVARMEMKPGSHAYYTVSMTTTLFEQQKIASGILLLQVPHIEMKLGIHAYYTDQQITTPIILYTLGYFTYKLSGPSKQEMSV